MGSLTIYPIMPLKPKHTCSSSGKLQTKEVHVTTNGVVTITPDFGYDGFTSIKIIVDVPNENETLEVVTLDTSKLDETRLM